MRIRTPADFGAVIRERRKQLGLDQAALAKRIGTSRQWVIGIEQGHPRAALGLVLRTLDMLGIRLDGRSDPSGTASPPGPDIDAIVAAARKTRKKGER